MSGSKGSSAQDCELAYFGSALTGGSLVGNFLLELSDPCDEVDHERIRPAEPEGETCVFYRGWEAGYERLRNFWTGSGYTAYKGGCDPGAPMVSSGTWFGLLDEIDEEEDDNA